jgi:hypothetical protein
MRPGRAVVAAIVSVSIVSYLGWNASHEVASQEGSAGFSTVYAANIVKYNAADMRGGDVAMRRAVQRMIIR